MRDEYLNYHLPVQKLARQHAVAQSGSEPLHFHVPLPPAGARGAHVALASSDAMAAPRRGDRAVGGVPRGPAGERGAGG